MTAKMDKAKIEPTARECFKLLLSAELNEAEAIATLSWAGVMLLTAHSQSIAELKLKVEHLPEAVKLYTLANARAFEAALKEKMAR